MDVFIGIVGTIFILAIVFTVWDLISWFENALWWQKNKRRYRRENQDDD